MRMAISHTFRYWMAIVLLIVSFFAPFVYTGHAIEMDMQHEATTSCDDGACTETAAQKSCLEHCLQKGADQMSLETVVSRSVEVPVANPVVVYFTASPIERVRGVFENRAISNSTSKLLTTQKRE